MLSSFLAKRTGRFLMALLGGLAIAVLPTTAASAHPTIDYLSCESGAATFLCDLEYTSAHEPATIQWFVNGSYRPAWDGQTFVRGGCTVGQYYSITVNVTDIDGTTTGYSGITCLRIWP